LIRRSIESLQRLRRAELDAHLLLIISTSLPDLYRKWMSDAGIDEVWDLPTLLAHAADAGLYDNVANFLQDVGVGDLGTIGEAVESPYLGADESSPNEMLGKELCERIHSTPAGTEAATAFERACEEAVKYLFKDQFASGERQSRSEYGFHRRDFLVRLRPHHDFWISLAHDFRSRYLVFEFKVSIR
jgi:hypothetical protein